MNTKRIVITGGPGTGKSSIIECLKTLGKNCLPEISREVILQAQKEGISQLFLEEPLLFSQKLLEGRLAQFQEATRLCKDVVFIDRGIPDVLAYMDYFKTSYPSEFGEASRNFKYDRVFILPPWEEIYASDNERYESFAEAQQISSYLYATYERYGYNPIEVPKTDVKTRTHFILNNI